MSSRTERRRADAEAEALLSGGGAATDLLDVEPLFDELRAQYADMPAPAPNAALEKVFAWGLRADDEPRRAPAVAWLPGRARNRSATWTGPRRVVVAVLAATLVLGGLAIAGAVPAVRDAIADVAEVFGLELPRSAPEAPAHPTRSPSAPGESSGSGASGESGAAGVAVPGVAGSPSASAPGAGASEPTGASPTTAPPGGGAGGTGIDVPPITVPPITVPPIDLPPVTLPPGLPVDVAPIDVPPITLPPVELPPIDLPPITLPPIELPPIF